MLAFEKSLDVYSSIVCISIYNLSLPVPTKGLKRKQHNAREKSGMVSVLAVPTQAMLRHDPSFYGRSMLCAPALHQALQVKAEWKDWSDELGLLRNMARPLTSTGVVSTGWLLSAPGVPPKGSRPSLKF